MIQFARKTRQGGAVILTTALVLLFLLGFMGIALDFGHLFVVKTELQTSMDSCALAAAQELDDATPAQVIMRATSAGRTAGNLNRVDLQGSAAGLIDADITFSDSLVGTYDRAEVGNRRYVKCRLTRSGIRPWLLQTMAAFSGNAGFNSLLSVNAVAVASKAPSQSNCIVPVGVCQKVAGGAPWGFVRGEWVEGVTNSNDEVESGQFHWIDFTGNGGGAREVKDLLAQNGQCNLPGLDTKIESTIGKPGKTNGAVEAWNTRFGIYKGSYSAAENPSDMTGYAWYADTPAAIQPGRYDALFLAKRNAFAPYEGDNKNPDTKGLKTQGAVNNDAYANGSNRRVITAAVVECPAVKLKGFACMLMLHPLEKNASGKNSKMYLEYIGDASSDVNNPCSTAGLAGGAGGPRVPVLVQ
ncbi:hypothetical protein J7E70_21485 [Variovorax paradoxus]|nr:TadE/TadG family type IV pilus assembly protein [Variovorax paradoxus]MBT2303027.1 hypothetical protein [Variovorax paradoxus]